MKEKVFKEEMKGFNISIDDIEPSNDIFGAIEKTIIKMRNDYLIDRLEVILNDNLIECKDKITNFRTILGCRVSYDNLPKDVSFIVRKDEKPTYEKLEKENNDLRKLYQKTYKHLFDIGNDELASYFQAQIDECPTFYVEPIVDYYEENKRLNNIIEEIKKEYELFIQSDYNEKNCKTFIDKIEKTIYK